MSPLRPGRKELYGPDWPAFSKRIRFERAAGRCECSGECIGEPHAFGRCARNNAERGVVLTVAHLCHDEACRDETHVKAMCQGCHLRYDAKYHAQNARLTRETKRQQLPLPLQPITGDAYARGPIASPHADAVVIPGARVPSSMAAAQKRRKP